MLKTILYNLDRVYIKVMNFNGSHQKNMLVVPANEGENSFVNPYDNSEWTVWVNIQSALDNTDCVIVKASFQLKKGFVSETSVAVSFDFNDWSKENYVLMPSAAYNGNRFKSKKTEYPPVFNENDTSVDMQTIITDVPRLNIDDGMSKLMQLTRDLSTPAIGFFGPQNEKAFWLITPQQTVLGDSGLEIEEYDQFHRATITISAPGVRQDYRYIMANCHFPSEDRGADIKEGDLIELDFRLYSFNCANIQGLFDSFVDIRKDISGDGRLYNEIPFYSAWQIQEEKYNNHNWEMEKGYYTVGVNFRKSYLQDWQIGWIGGMIVTYPLLMEGSDLSRERVVKTFDFLFDNGQAPSGFFYGNYHLGQCFGDNFQNPNDKNWHLIRKSADALYYIIKQLMLMEKIGVNISPKWLEGTKRCADAFVSLWNEYAQYGQFIDIEAGKIIVGGTTCAGIAPAALALAYELYGNKDYLRVSKASAYDYYQKYVTQGITNGGPGEILQCPDSESAFGLLESFVTLHEITNENEWLKYANEMAKQCFTWCVSYDYLFPAQSTFGKLNMHTLGTVYANVQNKHSAPGICTHSGVSLFKLYRMTNNKKYLELLQEIAHSIPQYLSREDKPISDMPAGWINERVQMSDWWEPVGEIFFGSTWSEVSNMLTYVEVPGLYVQPDTCFICAIDHIEAEIVEDSKELVKIRITNSTKFEAKVKIFCENSNEMENVLGQNALFGCRVINVQSFSHQICVFPKHCL